LKFKKLMAAEEREQISSLVDRLEHAQKKFWKPPRVAD
jgi:hypothetical protein